VTAAAADGLGRPLKLLRRPVQERVPIYLGAVGPKAVEQAGEIADGWLPFMLDPADPRPLLEPLERGLARPGRSRRTSTSRLRPMALAADSTRRATPCGPWLAFYLGAMGAREKNFYVELAARAGTATRRASASGAISRLARRRGGGAVDELIDAMAIATTPAGSSALAAFEAAAPTRWSSSRAATAGARARAGGGAVRGARGGARA
jgi:alkanesulfonate monooxygenase SsuD/methylene tetrahydromethanopterin reductase-like flavin-dependent oxidoreductase (luciferase family)